MLCESLLIVCLSHLQQPLPDQQLPSSAKTSKHHSDSGADRRILEAVQQRKEAALNDVLLEMNQSFTYVQQVKGGRKRPGVGNGSAVVNIIATGTNNSSD